MYFLGRVEMKNEAPFSVRTDGVFGGGRVNKAARPSGFFASPRGVSGFNGNVAEMYVQFRHIHFNGNEGWRGRRGAAHRRREKGVGRGRPSRSTRQSSLFAWRSSQDCPHAALSR